MLFSCVLVSSYSVSVGQSQKGRNTLFIRIHYTRNVPKNPSPIHTFFINSERLSVDFFRKRRRDPFCPCTMRSQAFIVAPLSKKSGEGSEGVFDAPRRARHMPPAFLTEEERHAYQDRITEKAVPSMLRL